MSIQVLLQHRTAYKYDKPITVSPQVIRLRPAPHCRTPILGYGLKIEPKEHFLNWQQDPHGNWLARVVFPEKVESFSVDVSVTADLVVQNPFGFFLEEEAEHFPFTYEPHLKKELAPYLETIHLGRGFGPFLMDPEQGKKRTVDFLVELNQRIYKEIKYTIRMEPGVQTPHETLKKKSGSCRDSAWLLVQILRHLGLAARFASGYLVQLVADEKPLDGPSGPAKDFTDLHAWCEVYLPGAGWVGLDPTSGLMAGEGHIPLACSPSPQSAAPISGALEKCEVEFEFDMKVGRLPSLPRSTAPYSPQEWEAIRALGEKVEKRLQLGDVKLTMGGEPTFVAADDPDSPEWNTAALGERKRQMAGELLNRLRTRFAPGGVLHFGQGKQYPGEPLPRWALACYWRKDGVPVWEDPALLPAPGDSKSDGIEQARQFLSALCTRLGVDEEASLPGYEDIWYHLWRERRLPANVDPLKSRIEDPLERERLARIWEQGLASVVGYSLPLRKGATGWETGKWFLRREHLFLYPGNSPMGWRLPLDSLPWAAPGEISWEVEPDPLEPRAPLPAKRLRQDPGDPMRVPAWPDAPAKDLVRTALCVEPRDGQVHVFLPPIPRLEDWLDLIGSVEAAVKETDIKVVLEGYPAPRDHRLQTFAITPDPGVIEVNIHPSGSWTETVHNTETLYEEARQTGLRAEKFLTDGRHTGTGGGNHVVMGAADPSDSPFLRRPDVLRSMILSWLAHPSLSYVFSGLFVGPTSQAPRLDEARHDAVRQLETALREIPEEGYCPPWLVDRVFRNLLIDVSGNTHRAEFCIDKLYNPDSSTGRLGLLELRGFEMPPHPQMSLVQQLFIRAQVARFWEKPYLIKPPRHGTALQDRYALPRLLWEDLADVVSELNQDGIRFEADWFRPHHEFRFPKLGEFQLKDTHIELRQALEPWHVLGEESGGGGTARYVDSTVERVQVLVKNGAEGRYSVLCNGLRMPMAPTGTNGETVAGVRFRAWSAPSSLHPTISPQVPLVFDVFDEWAGRAVSGCTYHVAHPGGRAYETLPVNSWEAEARRAERFLPFGHTPHQVLPRNPKPDPEHPLTLDLMRNHKA